MRSGVDRASLFNDRAESREEHRGPERSSRGLTYRLFIVKIPLAAMQAALPARSSPICYHALNEMPGNFLLRRWSTSSEGGSL